MVVVVVGPDGAVVVVVVVPPGDVPVPVTVSDEPAISSSTVEPLRPASGTRVTAPLKADANVWAASVPDGP